MKLQNQVAIVTGAAAGMGEAIAHLFAREGAHVVAADLNLAGAEAVVKAIQEAGGSALALGVNMAQAEDIQQMIDSAVQTFGTVDILVNNAGIMDNFVPAAEVSDELWEKVIAVNLTGPMRAIRQVLPIFTAKGSGSIVNVSSIGGLNGSRAGAAYTTSKHGLIGLTKNVAYQYGKAGVRCNAIAPGGVNTQIGASMQPHQAGMALAMSGVQANIRQGESDEIANVALFLASQDSSLVNGAVVVADGGWTAY